VFNEYSFVPRSAILNGLGSLRILPYRPSAGGTRPIKGRWRGAWKQEGMRKKCERKEEEKRVGRAGAEGQEGGRRRGRQ